MTLSATKKSNLNFSEARISQLNLERAFKSAYGSEIEKLYLELSKRGILFRPKIYLSDEWFSPDESPSIAVPFYLSTKRLRDYAKKRLIVVDGLKSKKEFLKLLRHECGHAIETAYNLKYSSIRQKTFGYFSTPYPLTYYPKLGSNDYIDYLGDGYGQAHPAEDFAETFAYWLEHGTQRKHSFSKISNAYRKLCVMDDIMSSIKGRVPKNKTTRSIDSYKLQHKTITDFFDRIESNYKTEKKIRILRSKPKTYDDRIKLFCAEKFQKISRRNSFKVFINEFQKYSAQKTHELSKPDLVSKYNSFIKHKLHHYPM